MNHPINNEGTFRDRQLLPEGAVLHPPPVPETDSENFIEMKCFSALNYDTLNLRTTVTPAGRGGQNMESHFGTDRYLHGRYTSLTPGTYTLPGTSRYGSTVGDPPPNGKSR